MWSDRIVAVVAVALVLTGCTGSEDRDDPAPDVSGATSPAPSPTRGPDPSRPADFDASIAIRTVRHLAGEIGPRHATGPAYREAAAWVARRLAALGYDVRRQPIAVPGGDSWGVPVAAGRSENVIATPRGLGPTTPHLLVGAHLDTVPQAPGAEDNASGVGVLLAVAEAIADRRTRLPVVLVAFGAEDNASGVGVLLAVAEAIADRRTRLPVVLVAFGAEEPRGDTDADHHYGSRTYVASLHPAERRAVRGMLSLDRVGVGSEVPVGTAVDGVDPAHRAVLAAARRARIPVAPDVNRSSDHWQFVLGGMPGVRLGSTPYAAYHSAEDVPAVVDQAQLARTGRLVLAWLAP